MIRQVTAAEHAPIILIHIPTNKRSYQTQVLPDSGADISAAGQDLLEYLDEHTDHLVLRIIDHPSSCQQTKDALSR